MSMKLPADLLTTKAAATEKPVIEDIRVALYGSSGYLQAYTLAKPVNEDGTAGAYPTASDPVLVDEDGNESEDGTEKVYYFQVDLPVYEGLAFVHVIANGPATLPFDGAYETSYMDTLSTGYSSGVLQGAYWDSFVLEDGIVPEKENGEIKLVNGHYIPSEATKDAFQGIKLIRNFAQIVLKNSSSQLTDVSFKIINTPRRGSIAVVDKDSDSDLDRIFIKDYEEYEFKTTGNDGLIRKGGTTYYGYASNYPVDESVPSSADAAAADQTFIPLDATTKTGSAFVFERPASETKPTYILLRGKFNNSQTYTYYRVDIKNESLVEESSGNGFIPIYRNYRYNLTINNVGKAGAANPADAATHDSGGNVSLSVEASKLTDISDGLSRLYVEYIEKNFITGVDPEGTTTPTTVQGTMWAQYEPVAGGTISNTNVTALGPYEVRENGVALPSAISGNITWEDVTDPEAGAQRLFKFQLNRQIDVDQVSTFRIKAENTANGSVLYRLVTVRVLKIQEMVVSGSPSQAPVANTEVTLNIKIDKDIPTSMFPLQFFIEDSRKTITPTGKDAAGNSIEVPVKFDEDNPNSYRYVRTVNLDEYNALKDNLDSDGKVTVTTVFKTISNDAFTEITVSNEYFKDGHVAIYGAGFAFSTASFASAELGTGKACPLTVSYNQEVESLTVRLQNCEPSANETKLIRTGTQGGYTVYTYTPGEDDNLMSVTFDLVTTGFGTNPSAVVINPNATGSPQIQATGSRQTSITIAAGALRLNGGSYTPGNGDEVQVRTARNNGQTITTFQTSGTGANATNDGVFIIDLSRLGNNITENTPVYFRYDSAWIGTTWRYASVTIGDLLAGNVTLAFS